MITECFVSLKESSDVDWLLERLPQAEPGKIEAFTEKVAIIWADMAVDEETAREAAYKLIFGG